MTEFSFDATFSIYVTKNVLGFFFQVFTNFTFGFELSFNLVLTFDFNNYLVDVRIMTNQMFLVVFVLKPNKFTWTNYNNLF